jgi:hypothetical protein
MNLEMHDTVTERLLKVTDARVQAAVQKKLIPSFVPSLVIHPLIHSLSCSLNVGRLRWTAISGM